MKNIFSNIIITLLARSFFAEKAILGGVLNPNSFGGFLMIFSLFVNNCKWDFEQTMSDRSFI